MMETIFFFFRKTRGNVTRGPRQSPKPRVRDSGRTRRNRGRRGLWGFRAGSPRAWTLDVPRDAPNDVCYPARGARAGRESRRSGMRRPRGRPSWAIRVGALHCSVGCGKKRAGARRRVSGRGHARERRFRLEPPERAAHVLGATRTRERRVATHSLVPVRARFVSGDAHHTPRLLTGKTPFMTRVTRGVARMRGKHPSRAPL